jgi:hypothetical protein
MYRRSSGPSALCGPPFEKDRAGAYNVVQIYLLDFRQHN